MGRKPCTGSYVSQRSLGAHRSTSTPHSGPTVVITHHALAAARLQLTIEVAKFPRGFVTERPLEMQDADSWIHGHLHDSCSYETEFVRSKPVCKVVSNPRGCTLDRSRSRFENPNLTRPCWSTTRAVTTGPL